MGDLAFYLGSSRQRVFAVRKDSPMIVGSAPQGNFIASDVPAILKYTKNVYFVNNMEIVCMDADSIHFYNVDQEEIEKEITTISTGCRKLLKRRI